MAKKAKKKAPARKAKGAKQSRREQEKVLRKGPIRKRPAEVPLPGMEDFKDRELSRLASSVADERHTQAESKQNEAGLLQAVQRRMKALNRQTFKAHGVEFVRVPGDEKLRVRVSREGGEEQGDDLKEPEGDVEPMDALDEDEEEEQGAAVGDEQRI